MPNEKLRNWCANHSTDHPNKTVLAYSHSAHVPTRCQGMSPEMDTQRKEKPRPTKRDLEEDCYKGTEDSRSRPGNGAWNSCIQNQTENPCSRF